jgi:hypothetical protein
LCQRDSKESWRVLADRCKTLAYYLDAIGRPAAKAGL